MWRIFPGFAGRRMLRLGRMGIDYNDSRNEPSFGELINRHLQKCLQALQCGEMKIGVSDLVRFLEWQRKRMPAQPPARFPEWVDN